MTEGITHKVLMIEPLAFGFNEETAANNLFQKRGGLSAGQISRLACGEFGRTVEILRSKGVDVTVLKDTGQPVTPDAVFPNNWVSFHEGKRAALYPLYAPVRRAERRMDIFGAAGTQDYEIVDLTSWEEKGVYLEGTGSMVLDRINKIAYAVLSERTGKAPLGEFCDRFGYNPVSFNAFHRANEREYPVYHTNVMMCLTDCSAVICLSAIKDEKEREEVAHTLRSSGKNLIEITERQMNAFAGNMLQLSNKAGKRLLALSATAYRSFTDEQLAALGSQNELVVADVSTIECYGGGSVRCMITEIF